MSYTNNFWTDGINANGDLEKLWSWSSQNFVNYGYLQVTFTNGAANKNAFLRKNGSNLYDLNDVTTGLVVNGYICEAQGFFSNY